MTRWCHTVRCVAGGSLFGALADATPGVTPDTIRSRGTNRDAQQG